MTKEIKHNLVILAAFIVVATLDWLQVISINSAVLGAATLLMYKYPNKINRNIFFQLAVLATMVWLFQIY
ncbi:hypothetical protein ACTQ45_05080 [Fundicoccus sp. Sow4_D5]|uniref:hypothetical protein n=1 Tax=unclassified Fundicoccus TaxID=2761543 RepID=UPI003F8DAECF